MISKFASTGQERQVGACDTAGITTSAGIDELAALDRHRRAAAGGVGLAEAVADEPDRR
jgi:hypothetical protein